MTNQDETTFTESEKLLASLMGLPDYPGALRLARRLIHMQAHPQIEQQTADHLVHRMLDHALHKQREEAA